MNTKKYEFRIISVILSAFLLVASVIGISKINWPSLWTPTQEMKKGITVSKDEMKVVLLGTGSPIVNPSRSKPAQAVIAGDKIFLVDCGAGTVSRLIELGIEPRKVNGVFFTHFHSDHDAGFPDFYLSSWIGGTKERDTALNVYGPPTTKETISKIIDAFSFDIKIRIQQANHSTEGLNVNYAEIREGVIYDDGEMKVTVFPVDHNPVKEAVGYRFDYKGKSVVFSGDTLPCQNIVKYGQNADLMVHEAYSTYYMEKAKKMYPDRERTINDVMKYHASTLEVANEAKEAHVKHLVLTHLMPAPSETWYFEMAFKNGMKDIYDGPISVGRDLDLFTLK
ncbi:MAG: MBL fold metallo-hydrolase [Solirubrobacterales bacterium]